MRCAPVIEVKLFEVGTDLVESRGVGWGRELPDHADVGAGLFEVMLNESFAFLSRHVVISRIPGITLVCLSHAGIDDVMNDASLYVQRVRD